MLHDRRKTAREAIDRTARLEWSPFTTCECLLVDVSDKGMRIHVARDDVPDQFVLTMCGTEPARVACRVTWRLGYEIGAEFLDVQPGFARSGTPSSPGRAAFGRRTSPGH